MRVNLKLSKVAEKLNSATSNEDRIVVYHALAMYTVKVMINCAVKSESVAKDINSNLAMVIENIASFYGEVGIVDKLLFKNILKSVIKFHIPEEADKESFYLETMTNKCFEDALSVTKYFSKETIDLINKNFNLYRETSYICNTVTESLKSIFHGD